MKRKAVDDVRDAENDNVGTDQASKSHFCLNLHSGTGRVGWLNPRIDQVYNAPKKDVKAIKRSSERSRSEGMFATSITG